MAVNWFEGGRRVSKLLMGLAAAVGSATILWRNDPDPVLTKRGPTMPWFVSEEGCPESAYVHYLSDYDWGGDESGLRLCYLALSNGTIPYAVAPTPPEAQRQLEEERRENETRIARGELPRLIIDTPWFYGADEYNNRVQAYVHESAANLKVTSNLTEKLEESLSSVRWRDRRKAFDEAAPWVLGICGFIWFFTFAMGWIVRGFAGVANGKDFRDKPEGRSA